MPGKPVIRGTLIRVELIVRKLGEGATPANLMEAYTRLTSEYIQAAITHVAAQSFLESLPVFGEGGRAKPLAAKRGRVGSFFEWAAPRPHPARKDAPPSPKTGRDQKGVRAMFADAYIKRLARPLTAGRRPRASPPAPT
jgi:uncharacterized protein (DUF433 family)